MKSALRVLATIEDLMCERGVPPTRAEIRKSLGWSSPGMLTRAIAHLQRMGMLPVASYKGRVLIPQTPLESLLLRLRRAERDIRNGHTHEAVLKRHRLRARLVRELCASLSPPSCDDAQVRGTRP